MKTKHGKIKVKHTRNFKSFLTDVLTTKLKEDINFATDCYRALCNMQWYNVYSNATYNCSWRYAGGLIAILRDCGENYIDFYCSGDEGYVSEEINNIFNHYGWIQKEY